MASDGTMDRHELDARFTGIEQNLQQLREDLKGVAAKDDLKRFATKDDLEAFATKDDLERAEARDREQHAETRRHFEVVVEAHVAQIRLLAEGHGVLVARADRTEARLDLVDRTLGTHDLRLTRVESLAVDPPGSPAR